MNTFIVTLKDDTKEVVKAYGIYAGNPAYGNVNMGGSLMFYEYERPFEFPKGDEEEVEQPVNHAAPGPQYDEWGEPIYYNNRRNQRPVQAIVAVFNPGEWKNVVKQAYEVE